jgi:ABC-type transporter lipoprotein component MlaA
VLPLAATAGMRVTEVVNLRAYYDEEIVQSRKDAFDYYIFRRDAFLDNREHRVRDRDPDAEEADEEDDDLYFPEDEL